MNVGKRVEVAARCRVKLERAVHDEEDILRCHFYPRLSERHFCKSLFFSLCRVDNNYYPFQEYSCRPTHRLVTPTTFLHLN
jgi:hypothetical protein